MGFLSFFRKGNKEESEHEANGRTAPVEEPTSAEGTAASRGNSDEAAMEELFSSQEVADILSSGVRPVTLERVCAIFDADEFRYEYSKEDEQIDIGFDGFGFRFRLAGEENEIIHMTSAYLESIDLALKEDLLQFIEDWHRDKIWPKLFYLNRNEIELRVNAEYAFDCEDGISDKQLKQLITCFVATSNQAFTQMLEQLGLPAPE